MLYYYNNIKKNVLEIYMITIFKSAEIYLKKLLLKKKIHKLEYLQRI